MAELGKRIKKTQIKTKGSLVSKLVQCGKNCNGCPHGPYLYKVTRVNGKQAWKYIGRTDKKANSNDSDTHRGNFLKGSSRIFPWKQHSQS
jgi:hypothetical protein